MGGQGQRGIRVQSGLCGAGWTVENTTATQFGTVRLQFSNGDLPNRPTHRRHLQMPGCARGIDEPTDDPESRVLQGTELRGEFEERPPRGANFVVQVST